MVPLVNIKIDNMRQQHTNAAFDFPNARTQPEAPAVQEPCALWFCGGRCWARAQGVVFRAWSRSSGQRRANHEPKHGGYSRRDHGHPAEHVFVLPNNKNIIMAAEQTIPLADRGASVAQTRHSAGVTAMLQFRRIARCGGKPRQHDESSAACGHRPRHLCRARQLH